MTQKGIALRDLFLALLLALAAWALRAVAATTFVTWDEPAWVYRSIHFWRALCEGRWADTLLTGHPGVTTMWAGALSLAWHRHVTGAISATLWQQAAALQTLQVHDPETMRLLTALLPYAKGGIPLAHALLIAVLYVLLRRILALRDALAAAALVSFDPYYLGLSRVLHIDA
ncbi:MAG: hypothetical protein H5T69_16455, partial [Chloroflexi bacterium]|nr:hypothetical protein [Chloroflexota bacterium]